MTAATRWLASGDAGLAPSAALDDVVATVTKARERSSAEQRAVADQMLAFADAHPDALLRSCLEGHFTGSALVMDAAGERALFLFHRKLQRWLQPGGHADGDGNLAGVAWREATEETGIDGLVVDPVPIDLDIHVIGARPDVAGRPPEPRHLHLDARYLVVAPAGAVERGNHESEQLRWCTPGEARRLGLDDGTIRLLDAALTRLAATAP